MSPWKVLFNFKFLGIAILIFIGVRLLPDPIQRPIRDASTAVWRASRAVARELGLFKLIGYGVDGVSEGVKLVSGPDHIENGPGTKFYYGQLPKGGQQETRITVDGHLLANFNAPNSQWVAFRWQPSWSPESLPWPTPEPLELGSRSKAMIALEQKLLALVTECEELWIYLGCDQNRNAWAVVIDELDQKPRLMVFRLPPSSIIRKGSVNPFLVGLKELEEACGLSFFKELDTQLQEDMLNSQSPWVW